MTDILRVLGQRIRYYRKKRGLTQEKLAELAELHPTYIGQLERGEKNPSIETIYKISIALQISTVQLLEKIDEYPASDFFQPSSLDTPLNPNSIPLQAYELFSLESVDNQKKLMNILTYALMLKC